jgi:tetratricopeptide (TPR) repeat protein
MGVVYAAYDEQLDRRVALKLLHRTEGAAQQRILREAQALAKLSHPNVVQVYEVGVHEGSIFVAMEFIVGRTLRAWVDNEAPSPQSRVHAYVEAGRGLAAAHRAGLVHRDFKPDNCMRGDDGRVRVLDFGLARRDADAHEDEQRPTAHGRLLDTALTATGTTLGTPAYMAPEQFLGEVVDGRADQFALCVSLWEALYGQRPFVGETRFALVEAVTSGRIEPVDKVVLRADQQAALRRGLATVPDERWESIDDLLDVLEPQPKRRSATAFVVVGVLAAGATALALSLGDRATPPCQGFEAVLGDTWDEADHAAIQAAFQRSTKPFAPRALDSVLTTLDGYATSWVEMRTDACVATRVRGDQSEALLDRRVACLDRSAREAEVLVALFSNADDDLIERTHRTLAALHPLDRCADAEALLAEVEPPTDDTRDEVEAIRQLIFRVRALDAAAQYDEAESGAMQAVARAEAVRYPAVLSEAVLQQAIARERHGDNEGALQALHRSAQLATETGNDPALGWSYVRMGWLLSETGPQEALRWLDYADASQRRGNEDIEMRWSAMAARAAAHTTLGDFERALEISRALEAAMRREGKPLNTNDRLQRGNILTGLGRFDEAKTLLETAVEDSIGRYGPLHPKTGQLLNSLGAVEFRRGDLEAAAVRFDASSQVAEVALGPEHPDLLFTIGNVAALRRMQGKYDEAFAGFERVWAIVQAHYPAEHREVGTTKHNLATVERQRGNPKASLPLYRHALGVRKAVHGDDHLFVANTLTGLGLALVDLERYDDAVEALERAHAIRTASENDPKRGAETSFALARALWGAGRRAAATTLAAKARAALGTLSDDPVASEQAEAIDEWLGGKVQGAAIGENDDANTP